MQDKIGTFKSELVHVAERMKIITFLDIFRWGPALATSATILTGAFIHLDVFVWSKAILAALVTYLVYTHANLYNYFTDIEEDRINQKYNPVENKRNRRLALVYLVVSAVSALFISVFYLNVIATVTAIFYLLLGYLYSHHSIRLKEKFIIKNFTIGIAYGSLLFIMTGSLTGTVAPLDLFVAGFYSVFSVLGSTVRDLYDVKGDREAGVRTVPVVLGIRGTGHYFLLFTIIQILFIIVPAATGYISEAYLLVLIAIPERLRLTYRVYHQALDQINPKTVPGIVSATIGIFIAALIKNNILSLGWVL